MKYIDVAWIGQDEQTPIRLVSELDDGRFEVRKLEFFRDGRVGCASPSHSVRGTLLGETALPTLTEINLDPQFQAREIDAQEFLALWVKHARDA